MSQKTQLSSNRTVFLGSYFFYSSYSGVNLSGFLGIIVVFFSSSMTNKISLYCSRLCCFLTSSTVENSERAILSDYSTPLSISFNDMLAGVSANVILASKIVFSYVRSKVNQFVSRFKAFLSNALAS
jgi:hypothetical protein